MELIIGKHQKIVLIDDSDYEMVKPYLWYASRDYSKRDLTFYALAHIKKDGKDFVKGMHRIIMNAKPGEIVDHINGNGLDNRRSNLRICTHAENQHNMHARWGVSIYKGVCWDKHSKLWTSRISVNSKRISLGYYHNEKDAAKAYDAAAKMYFGEFANLNFPDLSERGAV